MKKESVCGIYNTYRNRYYCRWFCFEIRRISDCYYLRNCDGLVSGMNLVEILEILGSSFVSNRLMSIFLIIFPVIAIIERYGLKERAAYLIGKIKNASAGKVLAIYSVVRTIASALDIRIGGVVQFVRPLILPMAQAAGENIKGEKLDEKEEESLKGLSISC